MDSANSGSLQSSSGGDEEYDSRADSVSAFMSGGGGGGTIPNLPQFFEPLSTYMQLQNSNSLLNNSNLPWPRISPPQLRSDPNPTHHDGSHSMFPTPTPSFMPCFQGIGVDSGAASAAAAAAATSPQTPQAARNPRKRSRASRRAPTTVLTTDTTNFRAMVQEFTGIPAPPFNSSSFPRSRLDFFGSRSAAQPPPYLRRPFAQKVQPPHPFFASSSALDATAAASSSMNYQLPITQNSNLFNINPNQNILTSLLQSNPKFPFSTSSIIASKPQNQNSFEIIPSNDCQFGLGHHNQVAETLAALPSLIPSDHDAGNAARWGSDPVREKDGRVDLRPSYEFERSKMSSFSASSRGKAPESNAAAAVRGEGMVESWICSSE